MSPLELPVDAPAQPELGRVPPSLEQPAVGPLTSIEIDLVITDDDERKNRHDSDPEDGDKRDRSRGTVIEISLV